MDNNKEKEIQAEDDIIVWKVREYLSPERNKKWYIIAVIVAIACLVYSLLTSNFAFAVIIVLTFIILILRYGKEADLVDVALTDDGVVIGKKFYDYDEIKTFSIVYKTRENKKNLYFELNNAMKPRISIPLEDMNPLLIRKNLLKYLKEDLERTDIPLSEQLQRLLKL